MSARPLLLGHRGARREARENTLEAFELCLRHGCDGFEFDVRLCADGQAVICHDARIGRRAVSRSAFATLGAPCLDDVLAGFASRAFLDIELKVPGLEDSVIELLRRYPPPRGYCISSFLPNVVEALHRADSELQLGLICSSRAQLAGWMALPIGSLFLAQDLVAPRVVDALHAAGKTVYVWTVNRAGEMRDFAEMGVDGIISDDTALLVKTLSSTGRSDRPGSHQKA